MENKKMIYRFFIFCSVLFFIGCISDQNSKFCSINGGLLYTKGHNKKVFLKRGSNYYNYVAILKDSLIYAIDDVVDINSFQLIEGTKCYYYDKNRIYALESDRKVSYPKFVEIEFDLINLIIKDSVTIKDDYRLYFEGFIMEDTIN
jgi:hypothetical protein